MCVCTHTAWWLRWHRSLHASSLIIMTLTAYFLSDPIVHSISPCRQGVSCSYALGVYRFVKPSNLGLLRHLRATPNGAIYHMFDYGLRSAFFGSSSLGSYVFLVGCSCNQLDLLCRRQCGQCLSLYICGHRVTTRSWIFYWTEPANTCLSYRDTCWVWIRVFWVCRFLVACPELTIYLSIFPLHSTVVVNLSLLVLLVIYWSRCS